MDLLPIARKRPMAFSLFRKGLPEPPLRAAKPVAPETPTIEPDLTAAADSAKDILELLELELGGMLRQLERAANSVASGAQATAVTLSAIRERADALSGRSSTAQDTAST